jgi:hypothetical protein
MFFHRMSKDFSKACIHAGTHGKNLLPVNDIAGPVPGGGQIFDLF